MMRLCALVAFGVLCLSGARAAGQQAPTERNRLPNSSFEDAEDGLPSGWQWNPGAAHAELTLDDAVARSGSRSVKITNPSELAPHVYGQLYTTLPMTKGRTYTLSCYVLGDDPGKAWIGSGSGWQFRFAFPAAKEWTRVTGTFEADDDVLKIMVISESPTDGFWVDDIQLEPGSRVTPYVFREPLEPEQARLEVYQGDMVSLAPNMVGNSSFETLDGGLPKGWVFDRRNTDATMTVDETVAHSGRRSLKLTNGTKFGAHVYGMLSYLGGVAVEPNSDYTVSCYVRSEDPGIAWIGGGPRWTIRTRFPRTGGDWQRVAQTFRTGPDTTAFPLLVISESPTEGFWIDDVKLERGEAATPHIGEEHVDAYRLAVDLPSEMAAGPTLTVGGWLYLPNDAGNAELTAQLVSGERQRLAEVTWDGTLEAGVAYVEMSYGAGARAAGPCTFRLALRLGGDVVAEDDQTFVLHTVAHERERLRQARERLAAVRTLFERARNAGYDAAYPLVSLTVGENFCGFVAEDLDHKEVVRAGRQIDQITQITERAEQELQGLLGGKQRELLVPRYVTSPIEIDGTSFIATVEWPDGHRERRPVFFSGYGHFASVRRDVEKFPAYGLNLIQIEFGPRSTVISETEESTAEIETFEQVLRRAAESNVAVNLLLSPHYFPQWAYDKWPEIGGVNGGFIKFSIDAPQTRAVIERHLRLTTSNLKGKPGLHSYCLSNEPIYIDARQDPHNKGKWIDYLTSRYGDLAVLNRAHRAEYGSFEDVPIPEPGQPAATALYYDWCRFNNARLAEWHHWMADVIHEVDPLVPVHAKIMNTVFSRDLTHFGVDPELFCELSQIAGNDCSKMYRHEEGGWANSWQGENMFFDLLRSCRGQPVFNSENHVIVDRDLAFIPGVHIRNVLWQAAIHGEGASTMWVWERTFDPQSSLAGSIMHRPDCADEHGRTALDLMRLAPEVTALQRVPARVAIVYSIASLIYNPAYQELLSRVYRALNFTGERIDFVTERQLAAGKASQYHAVFAPGVTHLPDDAFAGLQAFAASQAATEGARRLVATLGEGCFSRDELDRARDRADLSNVEPLADLEDAALRDAIAEMLLAEGLDRPVVVHDAETDQEAWGVEWQAAETEAGTLVNLVNYTQEPVGARVIGPEGVATNLLDGSQPGRTIRLEPLEPVLLRIGRPEP
jgi:hypothetical protein